MKRLMLTLVFIISSRSYATCIYEQAEIENAGVYIVAYANMLDHLKRGSDLFTESDSEDAATTISNLVKTHAEFDCAIEIVEPYIKSKIKAINVSADAAKSAINSIQDGLKVYRATLKEALDKKQITKAGTQAEKTGNAMVQIDKAWDMLLHATVMSSYSGFDENLKAGQLRISEQHKKDALSVLKEAFGEDLEIDKKGNKSKLLFAAQMLKNHLKKDWISVDEKFPDKKSTIAKKKNKKK